LKKPVTSNPKILHTSNSMRLHTHARIYLNCMIQCISQYLLLRALYFLMWSQQIYTIL